MIVLDASVLVAHLRGDEAATRYLLGIPTDQRFASIEIEGGMLSGERRSVASLFAIMRLLPVTDDVARRAGELLRTYRRSHQGIDLVDYAVAATVELHGATLATLSTKHFPMFEGLRPPY
jgi:predicted nucleic acid-binding protein